MNPEPPINSGASKSKNYFLWIILAAVLCVLAFSIASFLAMPYMAIYRADAGFKKAKQTIDPEQLREWALEWMNRWPSTNAIPSSEISQYIKNLYPDLPEHAAVQPDSVIISWGGGFFHWIILVGRTNFTLPYNSNNPEYPYNFEWTNGIYYTREADWKLQ